MTLEITVLVQVSSVRALGMNMIIGKVKVTLYSI